MHAKVASGSGVKLVCMRIAALWVGGGDSNLMTPLVYSLSRSRARLMSTLGEY